MAKIKHGYSRKAVYKSYYNMRTRCLNKDNNNYKYYGGRGIKICDRWINSFENFIEDMGEPLIKGITLERKDNNGDYCKDNCKWATRGEQNVNKRPYGRSMHKYIIWQESRKWWVVRISIKGKRVYVGLFKKIENAIKARNEYIIKNNIKLLGELYD